ncbi:MAG: alkaline phosphatase family protein [Pelosinus sp.]|nr:alkaline phosphatase family protein [Pelosinus sp.]
MHVLLVFIDGLGLGENDAEKNPLVRFPTPFLHRIFGESLTKNLGKVQTNTVCMISTDASLGVAGLPQSATGQTALFTGMNAPAFMEHHVHAFPGPKLTGMIKEHGLMKELSCQGYKVTSANMYTPDYMELVARRKRRHSASTLLILTAGLQLRSVAEMQNGHAVYQDITNEMLPAFGVENIPVIPPGLAGQRLVSIAQEYHFTLFEYFQTDRVGHKQNWAAAEKMVGVLDEFLGAIYNARTEDMLVIVTSDHGNFEDFSVKTHTHNKVPALLFGKEGYAIADSIQDLTHIKPAILSVLKGMR